MKISRVATLILAAGVVLAGAADAKTLKLSHVRPQGTRIDIDLHALSSAVDEATDGELKLEIFPAASLGDYTTVQERISVGAVDMACQPAGPAADRRIQISSFPFLAEDWAHARKVYGPRGPVTMAMKELLAKQDITVLASYPVYFGGVSLNREPVSPGDPSAAKGIKVRVPGIKSFQMLGDSMGYISSPIPLSEAFTAVQTGVVDGVIGAGAEGYYASFRDVTKYYIPLNTHFELWYLMINTGTYEDLSDEQQAILRGAGASFEALRWNRAEADQAANEQRLVDYGTTIVKVSPAEIAAYAKKVRAEVWPEILKDVGVEWGQKILDAATE